MSTKNSYLVIKDYKDFVTGRMIIPNKSMENKNLFYCPDQGKLANFFITEEEIKNNPDYFKLIDDSCYTKRMNEKLGKYDYWTIAFVYIIFDGIKAKEIYVTGQFPMESGMTWREKVNIAINNNVTGFNFFIQVPKTVNGIINPTIETVIGFNAMGDLLFYFDIETLDIVNVSTWVPYPDSFPYNKFKLPYNQ